MTTSKIRAAALAVAALLMIGANVPGAAAQDDEGPGLEAVPAGDGLYEDGEGGYFEFYSQQDAPPPSTESDFGGGTNYYTVSPMAFVKEDWRDNNAVFATNGSYVYCTDPPNTNTDEEFLAPVSLPAGALITRFQYYGYDAVATEDNVARLKRVCQTGAAAPVATNLTSEIGGSVAFAGGNFWVSQAISVAVDNQDCAYHVWADLSGSTCQGATERLYKARLAWQRQASPAPATASFADVPTSHPFFSQVEALVDSGVTAGCGGGNYCPDDPLTRGQMAVFLTTALGLSW